MQFHILSFEGPDPYAQAGGIATRVSGLAQALADAGLETHLWFVGDPKLPGHETRDLLQLHRWCQWISRYHAVGVYDGEEGKRADYAASLPLYLCQDRLLPHLLGGGKATILAEEWHTVDAVLHLDWLLRQAGVRQQVTMFWNANNTFAFERIDWGRRAGRVLVRALAGRRPPDEPVWRHHLATDDDTEGWLRRGETPAPLLLVSRLRYNPQ